MNKELYNGSGCKDPTPYQTIKNAEKRYYPLVYICSRYALDEGNIPIAPHLLFPQFMSDESERRLAMHFNYVLLGKCEEVWVFGDKISPGMAEEIKIAEKRKMKIRYIKEVS